MESIAAGLRRKKAAAREEIRFVEAMERYCTEHQRRFPTWSEVLEVVRSLGYTTAEAGQASEDVQQLCTELKEERDRLHRELVELREDYVQLRRSVIYLMTKDEPPVEVDFDELLAQSGKGPSMRELLAELEEKYLTGVEDNER